MTCKLDHSDPDVIPRALCVGCLTPEEREAQRERNRAAYAAIDRRNERARQRASAMRELERTRGKVASLAARTPEEGSVASKILASLQRKLERQQHEFAEQWSTP